MADRFSDRLMHNERKHPCLAAAQLLAAPVVMLVLGPMDALAELPAALQGVDEPRLPPGAKYGMRR